MLAFRFVLVSTVTCEKKGTNIGTDRTHTIIYIIVHAFVYSDPIYASRQRQYSSCNYMVAS